METTTTQKVRKLETEVTMIKVLLGLSSRSSLTHARRVLKETAGVLRHKIRRSPVVWQRAIRAAWRS